MTQPFLLVTTHAIGARPLAVMCLLEESGLRYTHEVDKVRALQVTQGRINPSNGYALISPDGVVMFDAFDLVHWLEAKGLRKLG